jgi:hypothetical protein
MIKLSFIKPNTLEKNCKATIHKSGKLGFTDNAIKKLKLDSAKGVMIAQNESDPTDTSFYLQVLTEEHPDAFKVSKAGAYYYINTKALFDKLKLDYLNKTYAYDIKDFDYEGQKMYKLVKREDKKDDTGTN